MGKNSTDQIQARLRLYRIETEKKVSDEMTLGNNPATKQENRKLEVANIIRGKGETGVRKLTNADSKLETAEKSGTSRGRQRKIPEP
ncbi:MAG: hypothetical protein ACRC7H_04075 [Plesiomonas shigelloides]